VGSPAWPHCLGLAMPAILIKFLCPHTGHYVSDWAVEDVDRGETAITSALTCSACGFVHYVDAKTGRVLASDD
jgi:hypothetical protein